MEKEEIEIPLSIFQNKKLSALEAIVKYMKEELNLRIVEIAEMISRNNRTIWATYNNSKEKMKEKLKILPGKSIPVSIFRPRLLSVLESLVEFLREKNGMRFGEIAVALNRDNRTVWTVYNRAVKKRRFN